MVSETLQTKAMWSAGGEVLILIVVEYGLGEPMLHYNKNDVFLVLILIVVEYGLGAKN